MGQVVLLEALPFDPVTGAATPVRLAGGGGRPYLGYRGFDDWRSGLDGLPRFKTELGFTKDGWTGGAVPQTAVVSFANATRAVMDTLSGKFWQGARVVVWSGDDTFGAPVRTPDRVRQRGLTTMRSAARARSAAEPRLICLR